MTHAYIALVILVMLAFDPLGRPASAASPSPRHQGPPLSSAARFSRFAHEHHLGAVDLTRLHTDMEVPGIDTPTADLREADVEQRARARQANADWNQRPQNETTIALHPSQPRRWIIGANDYGIGAPIGTGVYTNARVNYFPPFPLLAGTNNAGQVIVREPPSGTGDPALVYGRTRAAPDVPAGLPVVYMTSIGFSDSFCENGVFLYRSFDHGQTWSRPVVPPLAPPRGRYTVVYHETALDCSVFHDKEWVTVDTTGGSHDGRIYVTWSRFLSTPPDRDLESPIFMAYSDDNGISFSDPVEISGSSPAFCRTQIDGPPDACDEDQFSVPVVAPDGTLIVAFENQQFRGQADGFRNQYLVVRVHPDTLAVQGPFKVADLFDGLHDYPINEDERQTLCNSNFRVNSAGNLAIAPDGTLYVTWSDNRRHAGDFPFPTFVGSREDGYPCPAGKATDTEVLLSRSQDGGLTWSALVRVNQDGVGNDKDQWFPWAAVAPDGRVDIVFYDRRRDPGNKLADTFLARSDDRGQHWSDVRVSPFASNFDEAFFGLGLFIGDYNGLAIAPDGTSYPVWTGVRPGKTDSDIFFAVVP